MSCQRTPRAAWRSSLGGSTCRRWAVDYSSWVHYLVVSQLVNERLLGPVLGRVVCRQAGAVQQLLLQLATEVARGPAACGCVHRVASGMQDPPLAGPSAALSLPPIHSLHGVLAGCLAGKPGELASQQTHLLPPLLQP